MTRVFVQFNKSKKPENLKKYIRVVSINAQRKKKQKKQWNKREIITVE